MSLEKFDWDRNRTRAHNYLTFPMDSTLDTSATASRSKPMVNTNNWKIRTSFRQLTWPKVYHSLHLFRLSNNGSSENNVLALVNRKKTLELSYRYVPWSSSGWWPWVQESTSVPARWRVNGVPGGASGPWSGRWASVAGAPLRIPAQACPAEHPSSGVTAQRWFKCNKGFDQSTRSRFKPLDDESCKAAFLFHIHLDKDRDTRKQKQIIN